MITREHTQEALSLAYLHALAGQAGLNLAAQRTHDYGIDGTFRNVKIVGRARIETGFSVDFQMKATTRWEMEDLHIVYDLDARAHQIITSREPGEAMAVLLLLCLPEEESEWLEGCEDYLLLKRCCYWNVLDGPPTQNAASVRIRVPRTNVVTPDALRELMRIARHKAQVGA